MKLQHARARFGHDPGRIDEHNELGNLKNAK
jgi:hypothetical protein